MKLARRRSLTELGGIALPERCPIPLSLLVEAELDIDAAVAAIGAEARP